MNEEEENKLEVHLLTNSKSLKENLQIEIGVKILY